MADGVLSAECARIFRIDKSDTDHTGKQLLLHEHQRKAILKAHEGKSYVLTSGTGSGKSMTYIVPIVDHVLRRGTGRGIQAIVVYPMNALANSQDEELAKFLKRGYPEGQPPVRFARFTGQEKGRRARGAPAGSARCAADQLHDAGAAAHSHRRPGLVRAAQGLKFLVFDELHTYRGRQGTLRFSFVVVAHKRSGGTISHASERPRLWQAVARPSTSAASGCRSAETLRACLSRPTR